MGINMSLMRETRDVSNLSVMGIKFVVEKVPEHISRNTFEKRTNSFFGKGIPSQSHMVNPDHSDRGSLLDVATLIELDTSN